MTNRPRRAWRVCDNPHSNDWNDEPEYIAVPYDIIGESKNGKAYLVERAGWHGKKHQHYIPKGASLYGTKKMRNELQERGATNEQ